ncbi:MAG: hypothetical protein WEB06_18300 [Actinomycetota bacterium]
MRRPAGFVQRHNEVVQVRTGEIAGELQALSRASPLEPSVCRSHHAIVRSATFFTRQGAKNPCRRSSIVVSCDA